MRSIFVVSLPVVSLALVGCTTGYRSVHPRFAAALADVGAPAMPAPDALPACGPEETLVDRVGEAGPYVSLSRFCAADDGTARGLFVVGHLGRERDELRASWGAHAPTSFEGPWTVVNGPDWWSGEAHEGHLVGAVHGVREGRAFTVTYDEAGRPDGAWDTPFGRAVFDHGTADVDWSLSATTRLVGHCRDGLLDGPLRRARDGEVREETYVEGRQEGTQRVLDRDGAVIAEGVAHDGAWQRYRGPVAARCVIERTRPKTERTRPKIDRTRPKAVKVVVETECLRWVDAFVLEASCTSPTDCAYARVTADGTAPLTDEERGSVTLPPIAIGARCEDPYLGWYWQGVMAPTR